MICVLESSCSGNFRGNWKMYRKSFNNRYEGAHSYKVASKEPTTLLRYQFLYRCFPKLLFRFPTHLFFRTPVKRIYRKSVKQVLTRGNYLIL